MPTLSLAGLLPHDARSRRRARLARAAACGALLGAAVVPHAPGGAQEPPARPKTWTGSAALNASVLFGNNDQMVLGARAGVGRADSTLELRADAQTLYGEAAIGDQPRAVTKRLWLGSLTADLRPFAVVSPFLFATVESNLEKRIDLRYSGGAGAKRTFLRTDASEASLSGALLWERTVPRDTTVRIPTETLLRWSLRGRVQHRLDDKVRFSHTTFWQPKVNALENYLVRSTTELEYRINQRLAVSLSFIDSYDSEARARGSRAYNDGQILFGANANW